MYMKKTKLLKKSIITVLCINMMIPSFLYNTNAAEYVSDEEISLDEISSEQEYEISYSEVSEWDRHVNAGITIRNNTDADKSEWSLVMKYDGTIDNIWNAEITDIIEDAAGNNVYTISPKSYNSHIAAMGSVDFGFIAYGDEAKPQPPIEMYIGEYNESEDNEQDIMNPDDEDEITETIDDTGTYLIPEEWKGLEYAIYTSSEEAEAFYVNTSEINGSVHTNGDFIFHGNKLHITDVLEAAGKITLRTSDKKGSRTIGEMSEGVSPIEMPALSSVMHDRIYNDENDDWDIRLEDTCLGNNEISIGSNLYVDGRLTLNATRFITDKVILAKEDINYNVGSMRTKEDASVFISSEEGDININGSDVNLNAVLYAPEGTVRINVNRLNLNGRIIARELVVNGTEIRINSGDHDYDFLAGMGLFDREIIKIYDSDTDFITDQDMKYNEEYIPAVMDDIMVTDHNIYSADNESGDTAGLILSGKENPQISQSKTYDFDGISVDESFSGVYAMDDNVPYFEGTLVMELGHDKVHASEIAYNKGHLYAVSNDKLTWPKAREMCESLGGHLAVIDDKEENDYICALINSQGKGYYTSIGYTDEVNEGRWQWVNGSDSNYTSWNPGEPNNGLSIYVNQNYAYMYESGKWDDGQEFGESYYVCEWDEIKDVGIFNASNCIVKFTLDADVVIDSHETGNYKVYDQPGGEKVVLWKVPADSEGELNIPLRIINPNRSIKALRDVNVFYREGDGIRTERLDDVEISPLSYVEEGTWSTVYDSGHDNAEWTYFDYTGYYPNDSDIRLFAFASNDADEILDKRYSTDIKEITMEEACSDEGVSGIEGRYLLIRAEFTGDGEGRSPFLDSLSVGANTEMRASTSDKNRFTIHNTIEDSERNKPVTEKERYIDFDELISGLNTFPVFSMYIDKTSYIDGENVSVRLEGGKGNETTVYYDGKETPYRIADGMFTIDNVSAGEHTVKAVMTNTAGNSFSREIVFPVYSQAPEVKTWFDKETYYEGDDVVLSIEEGYSLEECLLDCQADNADISDDGSSALIHEPKAGLHTIDVLLNKDDVDIRLSIYLFVNDALNDGYDNLSGVVDSNTQDEKTYQYTGEMCARIKSARDNAAEWLSSQKDDSGMWGSEGLMNMTCDALAVMYITGKDTDSPSYDEWVIDSDRFNVDELCHAIWARPDAEKLKSLWNMQNPDGGFGLTEEYQSDIYDTLLVLMAESAAREAGYSSPDDAVKKAIGYIADNRNDDGGIGYNKSDRSRIQFSGEYACMVRKLGYKLVTDQSMYSYCIDRYTGDYTERSFKEQSMAARYLQLCGAYEWSEDEMEKILDVQSDDGSIYGSIEDTIIFIMLLNDVCME